jgi:hypothetical protein
LLGLLGCAGEGGAKGPGDATPEAVGGDLALDQTMLTDTPAEVSQDTAAEMPGDLGTPGDGGDGDLGTLADLAAETLDLEAGELPCVPQCVNEDQTARVCGPDGCQGLCGSCDLEHTCVAATGTCMPLCEPQCGGRQCGGDGCYGQCPPGCPENYDCGEDGHCYPACDPFVQCKDRDCGSDGCGGSCGDCPQGHSCEPLSGKCLATACTGLTAKGLCREDQWLVTCVDDQRVETDCGLVEGGGYCHYNSILGKNECVAGCLPQCKGRECGDDGCGGLCGICDSGWSCPEGQCAPAVGAECGWYASGGCENAAILWLCEGGALTRTDCSLQDLRCDWTNPSGPYACLPN